MFLLDWINRSIVMCVYFSTNFCLLKNDDPRDLQMFLHSYLVEQYKDKAGEWAYSLMESIQNNLKDDLICLFNDILTGKVCTK